MWRLISLSGGSLVDRRIWIRLTMAVDSALWFVSWRFKWISRRSFAQANFVNQNPQSRAEREREMQRRRAMTWRRVGKEAQALVAHGLLICFTLSLALKIDGRTHYPWWSVNFDSPSSFLSFTFELLCLLWNWDYLIKLLGFRLCSRGTRVELLGHFLLWHAGKWVWFGAW